MQRRVHPLNKAVDFQSSTGLFFGSTLGDLLV